MEHDGRVWACDHYVDPEFELGNMNDRPLAEMMDSPQQAQFWRRSRSSQDCAVCGGHITSLRDVM